MDETVVLKQVRKDIHQAGTIGDTEKQRLQETFTKRYSQASTIVDEQKVTKYAFKPSGRTIWAVTGKHGEQQVLPESLYCTCSDYYYRVMGGKKQVCYHIIAQQLAEALGKYQSTDLSDAKYSDITSKWTPRPVQADQS